MDLFETIRKLPCVKKVSHLPADLRQPFSGVFFLCPALNGKGIRVNQCGTGLITGFRKDPAKGTLERIALAQRFVEQAKTESVECRLMGVYADADALIVFSPPSPTPLMPELDVPTTYNHDIVGTNLHYWFQFYQEQPWRSLPQRFVEQATARLRGLVPSRCPENVAQDFVRRVLAGFALDGLLMRRGYFGDNPVLLGVESPEVAILQNAGLPRDEWLPIIQLA